MIKVSDLYRNFEDNSVLQGVNLNIYEGETLVIIGGSGSGKSVLLKHLIGLLKPEKGEVEVEGIKMSSVKQKDLFRIRRKFGMLFQGAALFDSLTVWENVGLGLIEHENMKKKEILPIVKEKLAMVGMSGIEELKPAELSGGMKKRVGLARAIAMNPEIILYDEPTTGLDPIMSDVINKLIRKLQKTLNVTSIVVTHDMKSAYHVGDRMAMLYEGKIIFDGSIENIKTSENPFIRDFIEGKSEEEI
ncbi:MAG: ABC transporter ATP-binding protein [Candidatus Coatesbacteria bacterium]|nr:ABC transporter ATP-binding protein [Candidatus Coatesbacteria bacterium]